MIEIDLTILARPEKQCLLAQLLEAMDDDDLGAVLYSMPNERLEALELHGRYPRRRTAAQWCQGVQGVNIKQEPDYFNPATRARITRDLLSAAGHLAEEDPKFYAVTNLMYGLFRCEFADEIAPGELFCAVLTAWAMHQKQKQLDAMRARPEDQEP